MNTIFYIKYEKNCNSENPHIDRDTHITLNG
jgi:hypothetical protein